MSDTENGLCPTCDRPAATAEQSAQQFRAGVVDPALAETTCFGGRYCHDKRVDWRARAFAAEAERDKNRARAREAAQTIIAAVGADGPMNVDAAAERIVARLEAAEAERDALRAAVAGRPTPPTREEAEAAHAAGRLWRCVATIDGEASGGLSSDLQRWPSGDPFSVFPRRHGAAYAARWWMLDADGRLSAEQGAAGGLPLAAELSAERARNAALQRLVKSLESSRDVTRRIVSSTTGQGAAKTLAALDDARRDAAMWNARATELEAELDDLRHLLAAALRSAPGGGA